MSYYLSPTTWGAASSQAAQYRVAGSAALYRDSRINTDREGVLYIQTSSHNTTSATICAGMNGDLSTHWRSGASDANPWIQIECGNTKSSPIKVILQNRSSSTDGGLIAGDIYGSDDRTFPGGGTKVASFSNMPADGSCTVNFPYGTRYNCFRIVPTDWDKNLGGAVTVANITFFFAYDRETKFPAIDMPANEWSANGNTATMVNYSDGLSYTISASSRYSNMFYPHYAFSTNANGWLSAASDAEPWLQIELESEMSPKSIMIKNKTNSSVGYVRAAQIYGSNDATFAEKTLLGSYSDGTNGGTKNLTLNPGENAFKYVRIVPTDWGGDEYVSIGQVQLVIDPLKTDVNEWDSGSGGGSDSGGGSGSDSPEVDDTDYSDCIGVIKKIKLPDGYTYKVGGSGGGIPGAADTTLKFVPQELTKEQQDQALANIGFGVSYKEVREQLVGTLKWDIGHYYSTSGEYKTEPNFSCTRFDVSEGDEIYVRGIAPFDKTQGSFTRTSRAVYFNGNTKVSNPWDTATWECNFVIPTGVDSMTITVMWNTEDDILSNVSITRKVIKTFVNLSSDFRYLKYSNLADKKWVSFGDSITARNGWQPYLVERYGLVHTNLGIGSTCMAQCNANPMCADTRIDLIKSANPDIVTILGGANDLVYVDEGRVSIGDESQMSATEKNKTTFYGAFSYVIESLLAWKPTLRIIILGMYYANEDGAKYSNSVTYTDFSEAARKIAEHYSLPFVDLHGCSGFNAFTMGSNRVYSADSLHPNDAGCSRIAELVSTYLERLFLFD